MAAAHTKTERETEVGRGLSIRVPFPKLSFSGLDESAKVIVISNREIISTAE